MPRRTDYRLTAADWGAPPAVGGWSKSLADFRGDRGAGQIFTSAGALKCGRPRGGK
jgi:hypothetical protein